MHSVAFGRSLSCISQQGVPPLLVGVLKVEELKGIFNRACTYLTLVDYMPITSSDSLINLKF